MIVFMAWIVMAMTVAVPGRAAARGGDRFTFCLFPLEPLSFFDANGEAQGLYPDLIRRMSELESWQPVFVRSTFGDCMEGIQSGKYDFVATIAYTKERARTIDYSSEPVLNIWGQLYIRPGAPINSPLDLKGKKVGAVRRGIIGTNFKNLVRRFGVTCTFVEYPTHADALRAVEDKEIDAAVAPQHYGLRHAGDFNLVGSPIIFSPFPIFFGAGKGRHADELKRIDAHVRLWKRNKQSYYYQRLNYWMGGEGGEERLPGWLFPALGGAVGIVVILFLLNRYLRREVERRTRELREKEAQYRELVQNAESIILRWNKKGEVLFLNSFGQKLFGFSEEEIVGRHVVGTIVAETDQAGRDLKLMIDNILHDPDAYRSNENENICKDGRRVYIQWRNVAIDNGRGGFDEILSVGIDITEKRRLELELRQAQKMEAVGTLAGGIAHDFNNILSSIFGFTELAALKAGDMPALKEDLDQVMQAAIRARDLVQQILAFSRKSDQDRAPLQIAIQVKEALKLLRASIPATIDIQHRIDSEAKVLANPTHIHQIIMNLCTNAYHAMEKNGGTLFVSLTDEAGGEHVRLEVKDNGCGMDEMIKARIFDPYFTTKEQGRGTGMGLAVVHGIVNSMGGEIMVDSSLGKGSAFTILLPVVGDDGETGAGAPLAADGTPPRGNGEAILLVDDEDSIRQVNTTFLTDANYRVTACADGPAALEALDRDGPFDLLITDIAMPKMSGKELVEQIRRRFPEMAVIMCTGYNDVINREDAMRLGVNAYVEKPIERTAFLRKVHEVLRARPNRS